MTDSDSLKATDSFCSRYTWLFRAWIEFYL